MEIDLGTNEGIDGELGGMIGEKLGATFDGEIDSNYDRIGTGYGRVRTEDPRIFEQLRAELDACSSLVNVGAGAGSYEPSDMHVVAVDASERMLAQRNPGTARAVCGRAERLPFGDRSFDAAMALLSLHHWTDPRAGLREMCRVARRKLLLLTWLPDAGEEFWLTRDYFPEFVEEDRARFPDLRQLSEWCGQAVETRIVPIPHDCRDGFLCAYWRRPRAYLDESIRAGISSFAGRSPARTRDGLRRLARDLASGTWAERYGELWTRDAIDLGYRLIVCSLESS